MNAGQSAAFAAATGHAPATVGTLIAGMVLVLLFIWAAWLVMRRPDKCQAEHEQQISQLKDQNAELAAAIALTQDFTELVRNRRPEKLDEWLARAGASSLAPFRRFAKRLWSDYDAVKAGVTLKWSNGPVEGHINRLKMVKRTLFGRAKIDLLSQRFLLAA